MSKPINVKIYRFFHSIKNTIIFVSEFYITYILYMNNRLNSPLLVSLVTILLMSSYVLNASIYCPPAKTVYCHDDIHNLQLLGRPTAIGYPPSFVKYIDNTSQTNSCGVGTVNRKWYVDVNQNNAHDSGEGSCTQVITVLADTQPILIEWPKNETFTCKEQISYIEPIVSGGPCDVLGIAVDSMVFTTSPDACYKIMRRWRVMNWCTYRPSDPNWNGEGYYEHTQLISVVEKTPPTLADCSNKIIGVGADCKTIVTLENSAIDDSSCQSNSLRWTLEIDLWADGTKDYVYGYLQSGQFYIAPTANNQKVSITIPELIGIGKHKIYWSVSDLCGNIKTCDQLIETKDLKAPTPYMIPLLTSAFDGKVMDLMVTPKLFDRGSVDNCTPQKKLKFSFSPSINDTLRIVDCSNAGFQFFTIYVTDEAGNQDFVEVFMLAFDNGSCFSGNISGNITQSNGRPIANASIVLSRPDGEKLMAYSDVEGKFDWNNISIHNDYQIEALNDIESTNSRDIADLKMLQEIITGRRKPLNYQWIAADVNADGKINISDLYLLKEMVIFPSKYSDFNNNWHTFLVADTLFSMNDVKNLDTKVDIMELKSYPSMIAVFRGDISNANSINDDQSNVVAEISEGQITKVNLVNEDVAAVMLRFTSNAAMQNIEVLDFYGDQIQGELLYDETENQYVWLSTSAKVLPNQLNISSSDVNAIRVDEIQLVDVYGRTSRQLITKNPDQLLSIKPNPSHDGCFNIESIKSRLVALTDVNGGAVNYTIDDNNICINKQTSGLYLLRTLEYGKLKIYKLAVVK
jgi:hypothetical protein